MSAVDYEKNARHWVRLAAQAKDPIHRDRLLANARKWLVLAVDEAIPRTLSSSETSCRSGRIH
jgi:hypothetical protein